MVLQSPEIASKCRRGPQRRQPALRQVLREGRRASELRVSGLGFRVGDLGSGDWGLGLGFRVCGFGFGL